MPHLVKCFFEIYSVIEMSLMLLVLFTKSKQLEDLFDCAPSFSGAFLLLNNDVFLPIFLVF